MYIDDREWYLEFVDQRMERPENRWSSFTYWSAMYTGIREHRFTFDSLGIDWDLREYVTAQSWANYEWVEWLSDEAIAEIVDISVLQDYGEGIYDNYVEEKRDEIFDDIESDYPDWFKTRAEFEEACQKACETELVDWRDIAEWFEEYRDLYIKEEDDDD